MKKKLLYESPDVEVIELRLENNQMQNASPTGESFGSQTGEESENGWS